MANSDEWGALLESLSGSFQQGRGLQQQKAQSALAASLKMKEFELEKQRSELEMERLTEAIKAQNIANQLALTQEKLKNKSLETIGKYESESGMARKGQPFGVSESFPKASKAAGIPTSGGMAKVSDAALETAYGQLGLTVPAGIKTGIAERAMSPMDREKREADIAYTRSLTNQANATATAKGKDSDSESVAWERLYRDLGKDYRDYLMALPIQNILRSNQGMEPLPEVDFQTFVSEILPMQDQSRIVIPGTKDEFEQYRKK